MSFRLIIPWIGLGLGVLAAHFTDGTVGLVLALTIAAAMVSVYVWSKP